MVSCAFENSIGDFIDCEIRAVDFELRAGCVERFACDEHGGDDLFRFIALEEGAVAVARGALVNSFSCAGKPDHKSELAEEVDVFGAGNDAAASGNNRVVGLLFNKRLQIVSLHVPEAVFALLIKYRADFFSFGFFDCVIDVEKRVSELFV